ncbi:MAG: class I SAM-dependent methyltransferase [Elusimicrobiota bacterium]|jgi:SAM-dependent methyltransferase
MSAEVPVEAGLYDERYYLENCGGSEFYARYGAEVLKPALAYSLRRSELRAGMRALDLGCGRGELLLHLRRAGVFAVGSDYAPEALKLARRVSGAEVQLCDAKRLPYADSSFDRAFFIGVIDHLHDGELERTFAELARVLRGDGFVVVHTCVNRLYYKKVSYRFRLRAARLLRRLGLPVREPSPPRSDEDERLHVNEHGYGDLARFFRRIGWRAEIEPLPNYKHRVRELYGEVGADFPLRAAPRWRTALYLGLLFRAPLDRLLAREFLVRAHPPARRGG